jgi:hypothetical protein
MTAPDRSVIKNKQLRTGERPFIELGPIKRRGLSYVLEMDAYCQSVARCRLSVQTKAKTANTNKIRAIIDRPYVIPPA